MKYLSTVALATTVFLSSCVTEKEKAPVLPEAKIEKLLPDKVMEGQPFNQQDIDRMLVAVSPKQPA